MFIGSCSFNVSTESFCVFQMLFRLNEQLEDNNLSLSEVALYFLTLYMLSGESNINQYVY